MLLIDEISMIDADLFDKARAQHWTCYAPTFQRANTLVQEQSCCSECSYDGTCIVHMCSQPDADELQRHVSTSVCMCTGLQSQIRAVQGRRSFFI